MNRTRIVTGVVAVLLPLAFAHAQKPPEPPDASPDATFKALDTDGDGRISKTEAEGNASVKSEFSRFDTNRDGYIDRHEMDDRNDSQTPRHL